jgi:hypothetical protein
MGETQERERETNDEKQGSFRLKKKNSFQEVSSE